MLVSGKQKIISQRQRKTGQDVPFEKLMLGKNGDYVNMAGKNGESRSRPC